MYPLAFQRISLQEIGKKNDEKNIAEGVLQGDETDGEFLEIVDSQQISSVITNGFYKGNSLRDLMEKAAPEIMGKAKSEEEVFPISVKMLVSSEKVRSHIHLASGRTMLFIMQSNTEGIIFAGLKKGIGREKLMFLAQKGEIEQGLQKLRVEQGDALLIPKGGLYGVGEGIKAFVFQRNYDIVYQPKILEEKALQQVDYDYVEPSLIYSMFSRNPVLSSRFLVNESEFICDEYRVKKNQRFYIRNEVPVIIGMVNGELTVSGGDEELLLKEGDFCLIPSSLERVALQSIVRSTYLMCQPQAEY